jgi:hypothetical protein
MVAARVYRADQLVIFYRQIGVQGHQRSQSAVDGGGLEPFFRLSGDEEVYFPKRDLGGSTVSDHGDELAQVIAIVPPGAGLWVATARPVDETLDFD